MEKTFGVIKSSAVSKQKLLAISGTGWLFDALDVGILSFIIAALEKEWNLTPSQMGWVGSVNSIGMAAGALLFGLLADRVGRKPVFMLTLLFFSIGSGVSALSPTFTIFLFLRFLIGMGLGGELPVASTLVSESVPVRERGRIVVLLESFWAVGWLIGALISYFIIPSFGWRIALVITAIPAVYVIYLRRSLPDSPRFEAQKKRNQSSVTEKMANVWSKPFAVTSLMLWVVWFMVVFSYYGMFLWLPSVMVLKGFTLIKSFQYVLLMTIAQLPGYFTAAWLIERTGRKFVLIVFLLGTAISAYLFGNGESLAELMTAGILLSFFNLGAWGALYAYTPEQYPFDFRGTGSGMAMSFGRIGGIAGPLLVGNLVAAKYSASFIFTIFCATIIIAVIFIAVLGKETKQAKLN